jgi:hypothetical protein
MANFAELRSYEDQPPTLLQYQDLGCAPSHSSVKAWAGVLDSPRLATSVTVDAHARG